MRFGVTLIYLYLQIIDMLAELKALDRSATMINTKLDEMLHVSKSINSSSLSTLSLRLEVSIYKLIW